MHDAVRMAIVTLSASLHTASKRDADDDEAVAVCVYDATSTTAEPDTRTLSLPAPSRSRWSRPSMHTCAQFVNLDPSIVLSVHRKW